MRVFRNGRFFSGITDLPSSGIKLHFSKGTVSVEIPCSKPQPTMQTEDG